MSEQQRNYRERRIQTRYPVDLHAKVRGRNQFPTNCRVRNICNGGVLIETGASESELPFQSGEHVDLNFDLPDAQSMDPVQAVVEVLHRVDRGIGGRFIRLAGDGRARLARFISETAAVVRLDIEGELSPERKRATEVLEEVGTQRLGGLLDSLLEALVEELGSHSERAGSDSERARITGEIGVLARAVQDETVPRRLREKLLDSMRQLGKTRTVPAAQHAGAAADGAGNLQLVDQDEFEIWLAKTELANRLEQELREPLEALRTQTAALFHATDTPMEPQALADIIEQALTEVGIGLPLQRLALQISAKHLSRNLGAFYRELLRAWVAAGLQESDHKAGPAEGAAVPNPSTVAPVAPAAADQPGSVSDAAPAQAANTPAGAVDAYQEAAARLQYAQAAGLMANLLSGYPPLPGATTGRRARHFAGGRRIADLLANLPADCPIPEPDPGRPLRDLVTQWLQVADNKKGGASPEQPSVMSPQVEERVDVADRLLSHMLRDPSTPQRLKSLIKVLTTRFLSMAVTEQGAVADANQPLVSLINRLENLALDLWLRQAFDDAVQRLLSSDGRDERALADVSKQVGGMESRARREYQENISNWVIVCESKERGRLAREEVRERLNATFSGQRMNRVTHELLQVGWKNLLELLCANAGIESARWRQNWSLLLDLHRLTGGEGSRDSGLLTRELETLIQEALAALVYIGIDPIVGDELLQRVEGAVRRVRARMDREDDYLLLRPLPPDMENDPEPIPSGVSGADWASGVAQVDDLPLGALVWMQTKDGRKALRLIWRNDDGSRLALTDTMGKKVKILRRHRLVAAFIRGLAEAQAPTAKQVVTRAADATLSEMQERLKYHETHDPLTGLANQRRLVGSLTQLLLAEAGRKSSFALCFLELDRYDTLTGTFGYSVGERMLTSVAKLLEGVIPDAVCLAYMGGSRFGLLMPALDSAHASEVGEAIRAGLAAMPFDLQGKPFRISGSLGIAMLTGDSSSPEKIVSVASVACLAAQREGGDRVVLFREDNEIITRQLEHMRGWAQAEDVIKAGRRKLRYQRIVPLDPASELSPHCEILLSVYDDQGVPLPLQSFIAAAEAFNMMREVDRQVIDEAFKWIHGHPDKVREVGGVAINLSGQSLSDPGLLAYIRSGLERWRIPVELVSFEVTETAAIVNLDQAALILEDIKSLGCRIALDDFGAGMSSYSYLKRLPVDYVKIDGSFVKDILVSPHDREIVKSFNEIAHFMGKRTIAEYVENQEILELLRDIGVDYAQGYAIEKPQFIEELV